MEILRVVEGADPYNVTSPSTARNQNDRGEIPWSFNLLKMTGRRQSAHKRKLSLVGQLKIICVTWVSLHRIFGNLYDYCRFLLDKRGNKHRVLELGV